VAMTVHRRSLVLLAAALLALGAVPAMDSPAQAAVRSCSYSTHIVDRPVLRYGDTGSCVHVAQSELISKGYSVGTAGMNGVFGPDTLRAVKAFQREYGLTVDGIVGQPTWTQLANGPKYDRARGPNYTSRVVFNYDDCPNGLSAFKAAIEGAKSLGIGIVIAPDGKCINQYKAQGTDITAFARTNGQYVINHSVTHPHLTTLSYSAMLTELGSPGFVTNFGRPPYGDTNATVWKAYTAAGMRQWLWTLSPSNWTGKAQAEVVAYVVTNSRAGDTVDMHMQSNAFNRSAMEQMKKGLAARGLLVCRPYSGTTPVRLPRSLPC